MSKLKILFLFIFVFLLQLQLEIYSAPYTGQIIKLRLSNGEVVKVKVWGNEFYQDIESLDGYTLTQDPQTGQLCYADISDDGNEYISTGIKYNDKESLNDKIYSNDPIISQKLKKLRKNIRINKNKIKEKIQNRKKNLHKYFNQHNIQTKFYSYLSGSSLTIAPRPDRYFERIGNYTGLAVLIKFPDEPAVISKNQMQDYFNKIGYNDFGNKGSIREYFRDISSNKLDYVNIVTDYYTAKHPKSYYAQKIGSGAAELITEALNYFIKMNFDFSMLSTFDNGEVIALNILYAGPIQYDLGSDLWPHSSGIPAVYIPGTNKYFSRYQITNIEEEPIIGIVCHENGHLLMGWPDLYDYGGESPGLCNADLMSSGNWNDGGRDPVDTNAFFRHAAGWANVIDLDSSTKGTFYIEANNNSAYRFLNKNKINESFYIENRQKFGRSFTMPGVGLTIWHVDWLGSNDNEQMTPEQHYLVSLEQADGLFHLERNLSCVDEKDFFYDGNKTSFGSNTNPNSNWWDGTPSGLNIESISALSNNMSFQLTDQPQVQSRLNLQVRNIGQNACNSNVFNIELKIINNDQRPIPINSLTVKMWFYSDNNININGCWGGIIYTSSGNYIGNINSFVTSELMTDETKIENDRWANREVTISFNGLEIPGNGGYVQGINLQLYRGQWLTPFDDMCNDYTKIVNNILHENKYIALFENNLLVNEWVSNFEPDINTGIPPYLNTKTPTPNITLTPTFTNTKLITATRTFTFSYTFTSTKTPTFIRTNTATFTKTATYTPTPTKTRTSKITNTFTPTITITNTLVATHTNTIIQIATYTPTSVLSSIKIQYYTSNLNDITNTIYLNLRVINNSNSSIPLKNISVKYWFTSDVNSTDIAENDYSATSSNFYLNPYVTLNINMINQGGQDRVLVIGFKDNSGYLNSDEYAQLQLRIHKNDWANYKQSNDYSFGNANYFIDWQKITGYISGQKVWGNEPENLSTSMITKDNNIYKKDLYVYPNPCSNNAIIKFFLSKQSDININIYDINSKMIKKIYIEKQNSRLGANEIYWDLKNDLNNFIANGIYILQIKIDNEIYTKKIVVLK